jgi:hypothetical protein
MNEAGERLLGQGLFRQDISTGDRFRTCLKNSSLMPAIVEAL